MSVMHGGADGQEKPQTIGNGQVPAIAELIDPLPFDIVHHKVRNAVFTGSPIQQLNDIRVVEGGECLPLILESAVRVLAHELGLDSFYCNATVKLIVLSNRQINRTHATMADSPQQ